jgi:hypothetical protein
MHLGLWVFLSIGLATKDSCLWLTLSQDSVLWFTVRILVSGLLL